MSADRPKDIEHQEVEPTTPQQGFEYLENLFESYHVDLPISEIADNAVNFIDGVFEFDLSGPTGSFTDRFSAALSDGQAAIAENLNVFEEIRNEYEDGVNNRKTDLHSVAEFVTQFKAELDELSKNVKSMPGNIIRHITNAGDKCYNLIYDLAAKYGVAPDRFDEVNDYDL